MSRWFRHYAGMMRDEKLVRVAVKAAQPVERVIWVWGALLESASEVNDGGRYDFDADEAAYFLRCDGGDVLSILSGLEACGRISQGVVVRWSDRQFNSDISRERQRKYRERRSGNAAVQESDGANSSGDAGVTSPDGAVTLQEDREQILEEDTSSLRSDVNAREAKPTPLSELGKVLDEEHAAAVIEHRKSLRKPLSSHAARLLAGKFARLPDANAGADAMIANGWQGFEPEWLANRGTGPPKQGMSARMAALCDQPVETTVDEFTRNLQHQSLSRVG